MKRFWHVTPLENSDSIMENGFNGDYIWATDNYEDVFNWMRILYSERNVERWAVIEVVAEHYIEEKSRKYPSQYQCMTKNLGIESLCESFESIEEIKKAEEQFD